MSRHKTVTPEVIEANRRNAQKSTGPKSEKGKLAVRHNAVRHGLLAQQILFRNGGTEKLKFKELLNDLERDYKPVGMVEKMLVEEIGTCWWKLQRATRWEIKGVRGHRQGSTRVIEQLQGEADYGLLDSPCLSTTNPQWECETLVIRRNKNNINTDVSMAARRESTANETLFPAAKSSKSIQDDKGTEIEATLKSSLPTILRYETSFKRDFYKAIHMLEELQHRRKEGEGRRHRKKRRHHS